MVRPVPNPSQRARPTGRPRSAATSRASRQARTGTIAPTNTLDTCAAANVVPNSAMGTAARKVGSGSQTSKAGLGKISGGVA